MNEVAQKLYPFQRNAVQRMENLPHVLLFDEMGLGKSVQALEHVQQMNLKPCLIICPKTLIWNWYDEIVKWYPDELPVMYYDPDDFTDAYVANKQRFFIMWHDVLARLDRDELLDVLPHLNWKAIIIDEAHLFRNWHTLRSESLLKFKKGKKIILTGTPIVNSALDLYVPLKLAGMNVDPHQLEYQYTYTRQSSWGTSHYGFRDRRGFMEMLQKDIGEIWIRRTKAQVLKDLPPKTFQKFDLEMTPKQRRVYDKLNQLLLIELDSGEKIDAAYTLALLMRLRQVALDPRMVGALASETAAQASAKTTAILDLFHNSSVGTKMVIYSNFEQYISLLERELSMEGIKTVRLTGKENPWQRREAEKRLQTDPRIRGLLATMQTGGLGLNLTEASVVVIADQWWNKVRMDQAIDRTHRIGQKNKVLAITMFSRESVDDHIEEIVQGKDATTQAILGAIKERGY